jgi:hypothetical protein
MSVSPLSKRPPRAGYLPGLLLALLLSLGGLTPASSLAGPEAVAPQPADAPVAAPTAPVAAPAAAPAADVPPAADAEAVDGEAAEEAEAGEEAEGEPVPDEVQENPWEGGLFWSFIALLIGGVSAVLGIWVDRDKRRPVIFATVMSTLITIACVVGVAQGYLDEEKAIQQRADLKRMLKMVDEIARNTNDPALARILEDEGAVPKGTTQQIETAKADADKVEAEAAASEAGAETAEGDENPETAPAADAPAPQ